MSVTVRHWRSVRVVTSCGRSVVIVFAVLADGKDLQRSEDLYLYLLQMASKYDHVKIGIDPDGDGYACSWDPSPFRAALQ